MFDDYYSFHPTIQLPSSIFVTSFFGSPLAQSARFVQALSGLPVIDVERVLEHQLGERLAHYLIKHHKEDLYTLEHEIILRALDEQPSIVVLRPSTLKYRRNRDILGTQNGMALIQGTHQLGVQLNEIHQLERTERYVDLDVRLPLTEAELQAELVVWKRYIPQSWLRYSPEPIAPSGIATDMLTFISDHFLV